MSTVDDRRLLKVLLGALVFVLGAQSMRFLFASITWYLRDTLLIGTLDLVPIALAPFVLGALYPVLSRWIGVRAALYGAVWVLAVARVVNQVSDNPAVELWAAALGTLAFVGSLPLLLSLGREAIVGGLLLGLAIDSAIKGLSLSLDLAYQQGVLAMLAVATTSLAAIYLTTLVGPVERRGVGLGNGILLIAIGPLLFIELLILQNQGWTSEMVGVGSAGAAFRIAVLNALALVVVGRYERVRWVIWPATAVVASAVFLAEEGGMAFNLLALLAIPGAALLWARIVPDPDKAQLGSSGTYWTVGMTVFVIAGLAYYLPLDLRIPFDSADVRVALAVILAVLAIGAGLGRPRRGAGSAGGVWLFASAAALLPLFALAAVSLDKPVQADGPGRYMSYNLHSAFNTEGRMDVEAIARVIEDSGAAVVGLQEVPRGRLLSSNTDLFLLLQDRLGFEYAAFFGTSDPTWGNAILSRYPIGEVERAYLPQVDTPLRRGWLAATIDLGSGRSVLFASTHLQHINDADKHEIDPEADLYPVHHEQIAAILQRWQGRQPAILVGDFNARPGWRQVDEILEAGWVDAWGEAGVGDGFTAASADPMFRIDYIFVTSDLEVTDVGVIPSLASDHFAVVADIIPGG